MSRLLIVGAGQAGHQVAVSLREAGYPDPITLVGAEPIGPYQRPPLSKTYLTGETDPRALTLWPAERYAAAGITLLIGESVTSVAPFGRARTSIGRELRYDQLALTTGGVPRRLDIPGGQLPLVHYLRDLADARRLREALGRAAHVVVIGGGFIGLEAAAVARRFGTDVTIVEAAPRLLTRTVAPIVSDFFADAHRRRGVAIRLAARVTAVHESAVELADGTLLSADVVVVGIGLTPNVSLASSLGLVCDRGVVVDSAARTSDPRVVAAGDCTRFELDGVAVALESVQNSVDQAKTAAATLAGETARYQPVPWFWSDQDNLKLQIAGLAAESDDVLVRGDPDSEQFSVLHFRDETLVAVHALNRPQDYLAVRRALTRGRPVGRSRFIDADPATPLRQLLAS